jgi:hypothetical protein
MRCDRDTPSSASSLSTRPSCTVGLPCSMASSSAAAGPLESRVHAPHPPNGGLFLNDRAATLNHMNESRLRAWICLSGLVVAGCDGAPSRNILGSYFPSWMVCALVAIACTVLARAALKTTGLLEELPAPLVVLLAFGCAVNFAVWLIWLA